MGRLKVRKRTGIPSFLIALSLMLLLLTDLIPAQNLTLEQGGIIRGPRDRKQLALVFSADSFADGSEYILSELRKRKLKGSFFLTGNFLRQTEFRVWIEKMIEDGHYLGPHSDRHLLYCDWQDRQKTLVTREEFLADLENNFLELEKFGVRRDRARYFVPPYEWYNGEIVGWAAEAGVVVVNFTPGLMTSSDYTTPDLPNYRSSEEILNQLLTYETEAASGLNGFIILIHLGVAAERTDLFYFRLGELIDELIARGYTPVRIDELLSADRSEQGKDREQTVINQSRVEIPDKSEKIKPSGLGAQDIISDRTAEKSSNSEALTVRGKTKEGSLFPEEGGKFSLTRAWINFVGGQINHQVISDDRLFVFFENNPLAYELIEVQTGKKLTSDHLKMNFEQKPVRARSGIWLSSSGKVYKLDSSGMGPQIELTQPLAGAPVESGNWLLLPFKKSLEARSAETLELLWKQELPAEFSGPLIVPGSEVLVPCVSGQLLRFQLKNGQRIDQADFLEGMGRVWLVRGQKIFFSPVPRKVGCYDLSRKKIRWEINLGSQVVQYLISDGHNLYLFTTGGIIYKLKQAAGDILWWQTIPGRISVQPAILQDELIVPSGRMLYGLDLKTGRRISKTVLTFEINTNLITAGDLLLVSTYDHHQDLSLVYALKKEPRVIIWPSRESPQPVGRKIIFTAMAPGLERASYEFYLRTPDGRNLTVRKSSRNNTWTWLPLVPGEYLVSVIATSGSISKKSELRYNITSIVGE